MRKDAMFAVPMGLAAAVFLPFMQPQAAAIAAPPAAASENVFYRLGTGDKLRVIVYGEDSLGGEFVVGSTGRIALPLIGELEAAGLSLTQLQARIVGALANGYLKEPRVSVEVLNYRPYYILGEVNKPGEYPYSNGLTVLNAVATAQGFTYRANTRKVLIKRADGSTEEKESLSPNMRVLPGDTIRVIERWF